jgi:pimeloyl-ACP methyl ester carboxylesterase
VIDSYAWRGGREAMLRFGPEGGPAVLMLPPLFEEANRTRFFLVELMRGLAGHGIASILPDLPGTNDSPVATVDARFADWEAAIAALPAPRTTVSLRGGALLDTVATTDRHWRFAPETGARLLRDMVRSTAMTSSLKAGEIETAAHTTPTALAGNLIHPELFVALGASVPANKGSIRTVRLEDDAGEADARVAGTPLWRRAEPDHDAALAGALVADIATWLA